MVKRFVALVCIYFSVVSHFLAAQNISSLLPDSSREWQKWGQPETYDGDELFRLIDGGADIFIEYGFKQIITQKYLNSDEAVIDVEIYEMNDSSSAFGVFSLFTFNTGEKIKFNSDAYGSEDFFLFWKGNYYISLSARNLRSNAKEALLNLAEEIEIKINQTGKPHIVNMFDKTELAKITYIKGNLGFYNLTTMNLGRHFKIEEGIHFSKDSIAAYIFRYNSEKECLNNYNTSLNKLNENSEPGSEPSMKIYQTKNYYLYIEQINNFIILLVSTFENDLDKISAEIKNILLRQTKM